MITTAAVQLFFAPFRPKVEHRASARCLRCSTSLSPCSHVVALPLCHCLPQQTPPASKAPLQCSQGIAEGAEGACWTQLPRPPLLLYIYNPKRGGCPHASIRNTWDARGSKSGCPQLRASMPACQYTQYLGCLSCSELLVNIGTQACAGQLQDTV